MITHSLISILHHWIKIKQFVITIIRPWGKFRRTGLPFKNQWLVFWDRSECDMPKCLTQTLLDTNFPQLGCTFLVYVRYAIWPLGFYIVWLFHSIFYVKCCNWNVHAWSEMIGCQRSDVVTKSWCDDQTTWSSRPSIWSRIISSKMLWMEVRSATATFCLRLIRYGRPEVTFSKWA